MKSNILKKLALLPLLVLAAIGLRMVVDKLRAPHSPASDPPAAVAPDAGQATASTADTGDSHKDLAPLKPAAAHERPVLVAAQTEIDAGETLHGSVHRYVFTFKNSGIGPLEIRAKSSCGCAVAKYDRAIAPGAEGKVEAELKLRGLKGKVRKTIEIRTNDPEKPKFDLVMTATIRPLVEIQPGEATSLNLRPGVSTVQEFTLNVRDTDAAELRSAECNVPYASVALVPLSQGKAGRNYRLTLTVGKEAPLGRSNLIVTVQTTSPAEPQTQIRVSCEKGITVVPAQVTFAATKDSAPPKRIVLLVKREGAFHIKKVECSDPNVEVRHEEVKSGVQVRLIVTPRSAAPLKAASIVRVETDDPYQPTLVIPVVAAQR